MIIEKTVLVFDICSSTIMMEDVQMNSSLDSYNEMITSIRVFLEKTKNGEYEIYKFLGDGFIILFNDSVLPDRIYRFSEELVDVVNRIINAFILEKMQKNNLPRIGITIGVDSGILLNSNKEYIGWPINIACRLQGKLDLTDSVNRIIISKRVYSKIKDPLIKAQFEYKPKKLKNVNDGKDFSCYESSPLVNTSNSAYKRIRKKETKPKYIATEPSRLEIYQTKDKKYQYRIMKNNGEIIYVSGKFNNKNDIKGINKNTDISPI